MEQELSHKFCMFKLEAKSRHEKREKKSALQGNLH